MCNKECVSDNDAIIDKALAEFNPYFDRTGNKVRAATKGFNSYVHCRLEDKLASLAVAKAHEGFEGDDYFNSLLDDE